ncbi:MAG: hypothetical protein ACT4OM_12140 [Actinomycetota bacterium]
MARFKDQAPDLEGRYAYKALWAVDEEYQQPALLRGHQLDGPEELLFQASEGDPVEKSLLLPATGEAGWRYFPSAIFIKEQGCYGVQIDGADFSDVIIFKAVP